MKPFQRRRRGAVVASFQLNEAQLVANLVRQVVELLLDRNAPAASEPDPLAQLIGMTGPLAPPEDPVLARLLPDAYRDDPDESAEFRRYTEQALTSGKVENAQIVLETLASGGLELGAPAVEVELDEAQLLAWLRVLTDVRLALAVRLGIETDEDAERLADETEEAVVAMADVYDWLGFVQETLVDCA
ncbi:MAG TPA: DUF2017 domain-containing protein [Aeromicrobium sp.]|nr:DUF2017 domain-containing protein [Aeromicrobium sp.]